MISARQAPSGLADEVRALRWYHTLELPQGLITPGETDLRPALDHVPLPASLRGQRCLDVGTNNGFWAFAMERRGADEVVAIDLEDPGRYDFPWPRPPLSADIRSAPGERRRAFGLAHTALGSRVVTRDRSVYELDPDVDGYFDFATLGTLLLHLRDPVGALAAVGRVLRGQLLVNDAVSLGLSLLQRRRPLARMLEIDGAPFWWLPNVAALRRYVRTAGFEVLACGGPYLVKPGPGFTPPPLRLGRVGPVGPLGQVLLRIGGPHAWVLARSAAT